MALRLSAYLRGESETGASAIRPPTFTDARNFRLRDLRIAAHKPETTGVEPLEGLLRQGQSFRRCQRRENGCRFIHASL